MRFVIVLAPIALLAATSAHARKPEAVHIAATEVTLDAKLVQRNPALAAALRDASTEEAHYYDGALRPAVLRMRIEKVGFKSAGKALAGALPLVGLFAGSNRNVLRGHVELVDQASGRVLHRYRVECDDSTQMSAADGALSLGRVGLSFLPFGGLFDAAIGVADGAANKHDAAERMLTRGFVMLSYKQVYGDRQYRQFAAQRRSAAEVARAGVATPVPAATAATMPVAIPASTAAAAPVAS